MFYKGCCHPRGQGQGGLGHGGGVPTVQAAGTTLTGRLIRGSAGALSTGNDQSLTLDLKVSTSYLELGGQVVGEGEELDLVQSEKVRCEGCGACQMHLRWGRHRVYGLNGAKGKDKGIRLLN